MAMSRRSERDRGKERFWRSMLGQWRRSGLSIRDFCAGQQLSEPSFYAWRRTLAERDAQARRRRGGDRRGPGTSPPVFVPVRLVPVPATPAQAAALEVVPGGGRLVRVPAGFDAATLRQLLVVLEEVATC
jgi:hypothetical protein